MKKIITGSKNKFKKDQIGKLLQAEISTFSPHAVQFMGKKPIKNQHPSWLKNGISTPLEKMHKSTFASLEFIGQSL